MLKIRKTKTWSWNIAVQVVKGEDQKTIIVKHIWTSNSKNDIHRLYELAEEYIQSESHQTPLFSYSFWELAWDRQTSINSNLLDIDDLIFTSTYHQFAYEFLEFFYNYNWFWSIDCPILKDLSIMRIVGPCSKIKSIELLDQYFWIKYARNTMYRHLHNIVNLKWDIEKSSTEYAKKISKFWF